MRLRDYRIVLLPLSLVLAAIMTIHVYADFNGIVRLDNEVEFEYLDVYGFGTISDLNSQQIRLTEGMRLTFFEPGDIQVDATMYFFPLIKDKNCPNGKWLGKYKPESIVNSNILKREIELSCFKCDHVFSKNNGLNFQMRCPICNTEIAYALLPPSCS